MTNTTTLTPDDVAMHFPDLAVGQTPLDAHDPLADRNPLDDGQAADDTQAPDAVVNPLPPGQAQIDTHGAHAGGNDLSSAYAFLEKVKADPELAPGHGRRDTQAGVAGGNDLHRGQRRHDAQTSGAPVNTLPADQTANDAHAAAVGGDAAADALLLVLADALDDLERVRIATGNRHRALIAEPENENDTAKGMAGTTADATLAAVLEQLTDVENQSVKELERTMRRHPLGPWVKATKGVGEKQAARLIAAIGWPTDGRPNPAKLWQYAGHGDPKRSHLRKGQPVEHSPTAKKRVRLIAEAAVKAGVRKGDDVDDTEQYDPHHRTATSPYGEVYLNARRSWHDRDTTDGHKHSHALRLVGKRILLDLWKEARRLDTEVAG